MTEYPPTIKVMARYLLTQYPNKPAHQHNGKKEDKDPKSEKKDSNTGVTVGAHIEDTTSPEESTAPSGGASKGAHVLEPIEQQSCPLRTAEQILGVHRINDDDFQGDNNPGDVSIDTENSKEMMVGSNITEQHTHKCKKSVPPKLLNVVPNEPQTYDLAQNYHLDPLNKFKDLNILSKTNNVTCTTGTNLLSQEYQEYYNRRDQ